MGLNLCPVWPTCNGKSGDPGWIRTSVSRFRRSMPWSARLRGPWSLRSDSNRRSSGYEPGALAAKLRSSNWRSRKESNLHLKLRTLVPCPLGHETVLTLGFEPSLPHPQCGVQSITPHQSKVGKVGEIRTHVLRLPKTAGTARLPYDLIGKGARTRTENYGFGDRCDSHFTTPIVGARSRS